MRSFVGVLYDDGVVDERELRALAWHIRLESSSEPAIAIDGRFGVANVAHRGAPEIIRDGPVILTGDMALTGENWRAPEKFEGEFSYVAWDGARLFAARDRFGVRPFYHARFDRGVVFSDSLEAILAHPGVDFAKLDDNAVHDYIAGGISMDARATVFAQIRRLPAAHVLDGSSERRYWSPHADASINLAEALRDAVSDRVHGDSAIVFMSGGLDSTALAALARETHPETTIRAATSVYRSRIRDEEERYAVEAARSIGIDIDLFPLDDYSPLAFLENGDWTADPGALITLPATRDIYRAAAERAPIALHGHPADAVLYADLARVLRDLLRRGRVAEFATAIVRYTLLKRRPPYFFVRDLLRFRRKVNATKPDWLLSHRDAPPEASHPLESPIWSSYFEWAHPLQTRAPIELSYPWGDSRVIAAALALPAIPSLVDKHVLREMLRGRVSETIRLRKKTYMSADPWTAVAPSDDAIEIRAASRSIDGSRLRDAVRKAGMLSDTTLRAVAFEYWLRELPGRVAILRTNRA